MPEDTQVLNTVEPAIVESVDTPTVEQNIPDQIVPIESTNITSQPQMEQTINTPNILADTEVLSNQLTPEEKTLNIIGDDIRQANLNNNNTTAMNNFLTNEYDYDESEVGSYWVAGNINDNETQMGFLNTLINEEMYDTLDLQKYYYDTQLATARSYAAQKNKETAYGFYRAAQEKAIAEGELTGWYMPAEGRYMLSQYEVAKDVMNDPNNIEDKSKAERVLNVVENWFGANKITPQGIKCLSMMNYEENVRYNTAIYRLKKEANKIAKAQAGANAALANINLREATYKTEETELDRGIDLTGDNYIGHKDSDYADTPGSSVGYNSIEDLLKNDNKNRNSVIGTLGLTGEDIKTILGKDSEKYWNMYQRWKQQGKFEDPETGIVDNNILSTHLEKGDGTIDGKDIYTYYSDGENEGKAILILNNSTTGELYQPTIKELEELAKQSGLSSYTDLVINSDGKTISDIYGKGESNTLTFEHATYKGKEVTFNKEVTTAEGVAYYENFIKNSATISNEAKETLSQFAKKGNFPLKGTSTFDKINSGDIIVPVRNKSGVLTYMAVDPVTGKAYTADESKTFVADFSNTPQAGTKISYLLKGKSGFFKTLDGKDIKAGNADSKMIDAQTQLIGVKDGVRYGVMSDSKGNLLYIKSNSNMTNFSNGEVISAKEIKDIGLTPKQSYNDMLTSTKNNLLNSPYNFNKATQEELSELKKDLNKSYSDTGLNYLDTGLNLGRSDFNVGEYNKKKVRK